MGMNRNVISFTVPGRAPASCSPNARVHWRERYAAGKAFMFTVQLLALQVMPDDMRPWERARVTFTQRAVRLRDADNFGSSMKPALDGIVRAGIIADDNPGCIDLVLRAEKVAHRNEEEVLVEIERKAEEA